MKSCAKEVDVRARTHYEQSLFTGLSGAALLQLLYVHFSHREHIGFHVNGLVELRRARKARAGRGLPAALGAMAPEALLFAKNGKGEGVCVCVCAREERVCVL